MQTDSSPTAAVWIGRLFSALVALALLADGAVALLAPAMLKADMDATGFAADAARPIGIIVIVCAILHALPRTTMLGTILITGFLGGAICTHFRLGEVGSPPQLVCLALGILAWAGLYLRNAQIRKLLPLTAS